MKKLNKVLLILVSLVVSVLPGTKNVHASKLDYNSNFKVVVVESDKLTTKRLRNRKRNHEIIVEVIHGVKVDKKGNGVTVDKNHRYISYKYRNLKAVKVGSHITTYAVYNPHTTWIDDVMDRYDVVNK